MEKDVVRWLYEYNLGTFTPKLGTITKDNAVLDKQIQGRN